MNRFETRDGQLFELIDSKCPFCGEPQIILNPVPEGTAKWAWYQMQCGNKVVNVDSCADYYAMHDGECYPYHKCVAGNISRFTNKSEFTRTQLPERYPTGWKLYEPEHKSNKVQGCDPCSLSITDLTVIVGTCLCLS